MAVELLGLSKFKLQLLALVSDVRDLREGERSAREELKQCTQKQQQMEVDYSKQLQELRSELASRDEIQMKLESRVKYLENENELLEQKEKDLKETINGLLLSRDAFIRHYEDSSWALKGTIQMKDRSIAVISEKLNAHLALFASVEKEATAIKQVLDGVQHLVNEKEQVVTELKNKVQRISTLENEFVEKVNFLENKLNKCRLELHRRGTIILKLKEHLEAEKLSNNFQPLIEELRKALSVKDEIIHRLTSEKQSLHLELHNMGVALRKFQDIFSNMRNEDQKCPSSVLGSQGLPEPISTAEHKKIHLIKLPIEMELNKQANLLCIKPFCRHMPHVNMVNANQNMTPQGKMSLTKPPYQSSLLCSLLNHQAQVLRQLIASIQIRMEIRHAKQTHCKCIG